MSENAKTITFVAVGLCAIVLGLVTAPSSAELDEESFTGVNLTKAFDNPEAAKRLRIVRFEEDAGRLRELNVAEQDGLWTIPSKDGYPADATKQMAEAATSLMDRKILRVASKTAGDHEQYGVIDPMSPKLELGQKGVGTRVTMSDAQNKPLADLIVGKAVRNAEGQRYVREAGHDVVYVVEIDPSKLSTSFEDWIEKDLLKLNSWDLQQVQMKDYSAEMGIVRGPQGQPTIGVAWDPRSDMTLAYSDTDSQWKPVKLRKFDAKQGKDGEYTDFMLAEDEELNAETLNSLKNALDDLKIVDVEKKPQGLSQDLKAGADFTNNAEAFQDLMSKGFAATTTPDAGSQEIISSDGEVIATMKNGAEYVLRFGNLTNVAGSQDKEGKEEKAQEKDAAAGSDEKKSDKTDVHRYLFVMARLNKDAVKQPELVKLPELPAKPEAKADPAPPGTNPTPPAPAKEGEASGEPKDAGAEKKDEAADTKDAAAEQKEVTAEKKDEAAEKKDGAEEKKDAEAATPPAKSEEPAKDKPADAAKPAENAEKKEDAAAKPAENAESKDAAAKSEAAPDNELEKVIAERKNIEQENQRKLDDYTLLKKGEESVKDLNLRFGDWYFVVDDDVFQKVRLSREKVIKKKEKKAEDAVTEGKDAAASPGIPGLPPIPGTTK